MQRRQVEAGLDAGEHVVVDPDRGLEPLAAVHDAVPDRLDLGAVTEDPDLGAREQRERFLDGDLVLEDLFGLLERPRPVGLVLDDRGPADVVDQPLRQRAVAAGRRGVGVGLHQLELERRAAAVEDQDLHRRHSNGLGR